MCQVKGNLVLAQQYSFTETKKHLTVPVPLGIFQELQRHMWLEARLEAEANPLHDGKLRILGFLPFLMGCSIKVSSNGY